MLVQPMKIYKLEISFAILKLSIIILLFVTSLAMLKEKRCFFSKMQIARRIAWSF